VNEKAKTKYFSILQSVGKAPVNPHLIHYVFELSEIDCVKEKTKDLSTIIYDEKGHMLYSSPKDVAGGWNSILPDSVAEKLKNIVCRAPAASQKVVAAESAVTDNNPDQVNLLHNDMAQSGEKAVRNLITRWLNGWQSGDMKIYRSCYAPDFISRGMNRNVWSSHKTSVHRKSKNIRIRIEELQISVKENNATATFTQYYHSDIFKNSGIKKLELRKINDEWKIYREIM
jgi:ketosteroid isomerase-like protein